jgi:hypothetical protein
LGQTLGEILPIVSVQLAAIQIETDGLSAHVDDLVITWSGRGDDDAACARNQSGCGRCCDRVNLCGDADVREAAF